jgi:hypothetical protein
VADVGRVLGDLYEPIAQNRGMALNVKALRGKRWVNETA